MADFKASWTVGLKSLTYQPLTSSRVSRLCLGGLKYPLLGWPAGWLAGLLASWLDC